MEIVPKDIMSPAHPKEISKEFKELVSLEHLFSSAVCIINTQIGKAPGCLL